MATLALDPILVAKINALLASCAGTDSESGLGTEDIVELFESFLEERRHRVETSHTHDTNGWDAAKLAS